MNRRGFFGLFAAAAATAIALPELELLVPTRTIFLPPAGGWRAFTPQLWADVFVRQLLERIDANGAAMSRINCMYDQEFLRGDQWTPAEMARASTIDIRKPPRYRQALVEV